VSEGRAADEAVDRSRQRTISRSALGRHRRFAEVSPELGRLDEQAVDDAMRADPDGTLGLLAELTGATDARLRELARSLAGRLVLDVARRGPVHPRGTGTIASRPYRPDAGDLDVDASTEAITEAIASDAAVDPERLRVRQWVRPATALCLLVDRSGSMGGVALATSAVAAAAVAFRAPHDYSVLGFSRDVVAVKSQGTDKPAERVVDGVLALRGHGTTDLAGALWAAARQLERSRAGRKITVLLSDCRATEPGDVHAAAADLDELVIVAPAGDADAAAELAASVGAPMATVDGPASVVPALLQVLS